MNLKQIKLSPNRRKEENEIFEKKFGARDYMETYYPENIDVEKFARAIKQIQQAIEDNDGRVNIEDIVSETNLPHEIVENIVIFDFQRRMSSHFAKAFPKGNMKILDVGGGPTIYQHIPVSLQADKITHSEFLQQNRTEVERWLNQEDGAYNWDAYFSLMKRTLQEDEGYMSILREQSESSDKITELHANKTLHILESEDIEELKDHLRNTLSSVVYGNVFKKGLELPSSFLGGRVDLLTSNFTIESATADYSTWKNGMNNIINKIKPGGYLSLQAIRNATWYQVGNERMPATPINEDDITNFLTKNGFSIIELSVLEGSDKKNVGYDGMVFVMAQKGR